MGKTIGNITNDKDKSMQDIRDTNMAGSLRASRQKKSIRKTKSPTQNSGGGVCFSLFKCCMTPREDRENQVKIE